MLTIDNILNEQIESDSTELLIRENGLVKDLTNIIIEHLKPHLKKSFEKVQNDITDQIIEDCNIIEKLKFLADDVLLDIISKYGEMEIVEDEKKMGISNIWNMK